MNKKCIKQDSNFIEYPLYSLSGKLNNFEIVTEKGTYTVEVSHEYGAPDTTDAIFLYSFLKISQNQKFKRFLHLSKYKILKECDIEPSEFWYNRLETSFERWKRVVLKFDGYFFGEDKPTKRIYGVINEVKENKDSPGLTIELGKSFLQQVQNSNYFTQIDFEELKRLKRPVARRLYEFLQKQFYYDYDYKIETLKLAKKLTLQQKYVSQVIEKLKPAINEINKKTDLKIDFKSYKNDNNETILVFTKQSKTKGSNNLKVSIPKIESQQKLFDSTDDPLFLDLINLLDPKYQTNDEIKQKLLLWYQQKDYNYVRHNIMYTNKTSNKNYKIFLFKALKENWGKEMNEDEGNKKQKEKQIQLKQLEETQESIINSEKEKEDKRKAQEIIDWIESLSKTQKKNFIAKTIDSIDDERKNIAQASLNVNKKLMIPTIMMFSKELAEQKRAMMKIEV